jgi:signal peptidase I
MSDFHWDYEVFLFLAVIISFVAWLMVKLKKSNNKNNNRIQSIRAIGSFFPVLLIILSFRSFAYEPFRIPSSSMMPTLLTGDFILVDKSAYGIKMPVFHNTLIDTGQPQRGDVFVFRSVEDPSVDVIKRVIGVPGDRIKYDELTKKLYVNDEVIEEQYNGLYQGFHDDINPTGLKQKTANTGETSHAVLYSDLVRRSYHLTDLVVPEGHYFGMGDNRDFSKDSRVFGLIPEKNIVGQAKIIWMHWRPNAFWQGLKRIGQVL